jgi:hypothetical protein
MAIRFYVDADLLGVAKVLVGVRADVTHPGDPGGMGLDGLPRAACPIAPGAKDAIWIPKVAALGWVIITRDRHVQSRPAERRAIVDHGARVITLDARHALNKWSQLEIIVTQWRAIEALADHPGPWIYTVARTSRRKDL